MMRLHERSAVDRAPAYVPPRQIGPTPAAVVALVIVHVLAVVGLVSIVAMIAGALA
jgi:hypothetical protein